MRSAGLHFPRIGITSQVVALIASACMCLTSTLSTSSPLQAAEPQIDVEKQLIEAQQLLHAGNSTEAESRFSELLHRCGSDARFIRQRNGCLKGLATIFMESGRYVPALKMQREYLASLQAIEAIEPQDLVSAAIVVAELEEALGRPDTAIEVLRTWKAQTDNRRLNPLLRMQMVVKLAALTGSNGRDATAEWQSAKSIGESALAQIDSRILPVDYRPTIIRDLADCYEALGNRKQAIELIRKELDSPRLADDSTERSSLLTKLAVMSAGEQRPEEALHIIRQAIKIERGAENRECTVDRLLIQQALLQDLVGGADAKRSWEDAAKSHADTLAKIRLGRISLKWSDATLEGLALARSKLGDVAGETESVRALVECRTEALGAEHVACIRAKARLGALYALAEDYMRAKPYLTETVEFQRRRSSPQPLELADALNNLGIVERALGSYDDALRLIGEALAIRERLLPPSDLVRIGTAYSLAGVSFAGGRYAESVQQYLRVIDQCRNLGKNADDLQSKALLSLAMVYRSQGQVDRAGQACLDALAIQRRNPKGRKIDLVAYYNALAALKTAQGQYVEALQWSQQALDTCLEHGAGRSAEAAAARSQLAVLHREAGDFDEAERLWKEALEIYRRQGQASLTARTLNYLGVLAFHRERLDVAAGYFSDAYAVYQVGEGAPQEHYSVLCNLASVCYARGSQSEASDYLRQAIQLTEVPRTAVSGAEHERAEFFARFSRAFDLLVDWELEAGKIGDAFLSAERARNRTFLDQLALAGVDIRSTLDEDSLPLLERERRLSLKLNSLRAEEHRRAAEDSEASRRLREDIMKTQQEYAEAWSEIRDRSKYYRELLTRDQSLLSLAQLRQSVIDARSLMLCYYLGVDRSYLFVIGHGESDVWFFPLKYSGDGKDLKRQELRSGSSEESASHLNSQRGVVAAVQSPKGFDVAEDFKDTPITAGYVNRRQIARLVSSYRQELRSADFGQTRGVVGSSVSNKGDTIRSSSLVLGDILLPDAVRKLVRERNPSQIIVIPDGALHQLPLEAVMLEQGESPKFVLDSFPPLAYAPSANILAKLMQRSDSGTNKIDLLSVGNPAYLSSDGKTPATDAEDEFAPQFTPLPGTKTECNRVVAVFPADRVVVRMDSAATEQEIRAQIEGPRFVHLAAHGFVHEGYENLFGAIALAPPTTTAWTLENDGLLELREIQSLRLNGCALAVLSACETNVGPERPLEAASTLAQAFLAAGAKRVVASHWNVADNSTSELMASFFQEVTRAPVGNASVNYAQAMQLARKKIRNDPRWSAPYYWAPFVLIGPGGN